METWKIVAPGWTTRVSLMDGSVSDPGTRGELYGLSRRQLSSSCLARGWIMRKT